MIPQYPLRESTGLGPSEPLKVRGTSPSRWLLCVHFPRRSFTVLIRIILSTPACGECVVHGHTVAIAPLYQIRPSVWSPTRLAWAEWRMADRAGIKHLWLTELTVYRPSRRCGPRHWERADAASHRGFDKGARFTLGYALSANHFTL